MIASRRKRHDTGSEAIARWLECVGVEAIGRPAAGAFGIDICSVTHVADPKARRTMHVAGRVTSGAHRRTERALRDRVVAARVVGVPEEMLRVEVLV